ncbi:MAG: hydrolase, partial [Gammaproteobacteria bacterium]
MSNHRIRAVLLDYGGVIADEGFQNVLCAMANEQGLAIDATMEVARNAVYDTGFVLGWGSEEDFWKAMRQGAGIEGNDDALTR